MLYFNSHCHIINLELMPPELYVKRLNVPEPLIDALIDVLKNQTKSIKYIEKLIDFFGDELHLNNFIKLFNMNFNEQIKALLKSMDKIGIDIATPLMLDIAINTEERISFDKQINMFSKLVIQSKGRLLPFFMFDPRRNNIIEILIDALENKGFLGIKMYPPMGFNPNPESGYNNYKVNNNLKALYEYCEYKKIPITAHCSQGGIRGNISEEQAHAITHPYNWFNVLWEHKDLKVNLAHFGGNNQFINIFKNKKRKNWTDTIAKLMMEFENLYTDTAFHNGAFDNTKDYFIALNKAIMNPFVSGKILGGTDYPLEQLYYSDFDIIKKYKDNLDKDIFNIIFSETPNAFLFDDKGYPQRITKLLIF